MLKIWSYCAPVKNAVRKEDLRVGVKDRLTCPLKRLDVCLCWKTDFEKRLLFGHMTELECRKLVKEVVGVGLSSSTVHLHQRKSRVCLVPSVCPSAPLCLSLTSLSLQPLPPSLLP